MGNTVFSRGGAAGVSKGSLCLTGPGFHGGVSRSEGPLAGLGLYQLSDVLKIQLVLTSDSYTKFHLKECRFK